MVTYGYADEDLQKKFEEHRLEEEHMMENAYPTPEERIAELESKLDAFESAYQRGVDEA